MYGKFRDKKWWFAVASFFFSLTILFYLRGERLAPIALEYSYILERREDRNLSYHRSNPSVGTGYMLVNQYADQITGASFSVLSLQCFAGAVDERIKVVEPFISEGSGLGYALKENEEDRLEVNNQVRLEDIFDLDRWKNHISDISEGHSFACLEGWKYFLQFSPKQLIVVGKYCSYTEDEGCNNRFHRDVTFFANKYEFKVVRSVKMERKEFTFQELVDLVYGGYSPAETVVLFQQWGGLVSKLYDRRVAVSGIDKCIRNNYHSFLFENSKSIVDDSRKYKAKYLHGEYISVMLRTERFALHHYKTLHSTKAKLMVFAKCLSGIKRAVHRMRKHYSTSGIFVAVDSCKHGSRGIRNVAAPAFMSNELLDTITRNFFEALRPYGSTMTVEEWESSFDNVSSFQAPGYVAQLQKNLAASGRCLVTAGGGSFQDTARSLYTRHYGNGQHLCVRDIQECA